MSYLLLTPEEIDQILEIGSRRISSKLSLFDEGRVHCENVARAQHAKILKELKRYFDNHTSLYEYWLDMKDLIGRMEKE